MVINEDYAMTATSASTIASASTYTLPSDFGKELYVFNSVTLENIPYMSFEQLELEYEKELTSTGTINYYTIFESTVAASGGAARTKKIRFFRAPTTDNYFTIPFTIAPTDLSVAGDELVLDCETAVEYGATSDAWAYKRQMAKSQYYEVLFEKAIQALMWDKGNQPNVVTQFNVAPLDRGMGI